MAKQLGWGGLIETTARVFVGRASGASTLPLAMAVLPSLPTLGRAGGRMD